MNIELVAIFAAVLVGPPLLTIVLRRPLTYLAAKLMRIGEAVCPFIPLRRYGPDAFAAGALTQLLCIPDYAVLYATLTRSDGFGPLVIPVCIAVFATNSLLLRLARSLPVFDRKRETGALAK